MSYCADFEGQGKSYLYNNGAVVNCQSPYGVSKYSISFWLKSFGSSSSSTEVESVTLDSFFEDKRQPIDVIKMDMEGAEMAALLGMDRIIRENKNLKMFIGFYPSAIREMGYSPEEFIHSLLEKYGFSITVIDELRTTLAQSVKVSSVDEIMNLCQNEERIVNLFLER